MYFRTASRNWTIVNAMIMEQCSDCESFNLIISSLNYITINYALGSELKCFLLSPIQLRHSRFYFTKSNVACETKRLFCSTERNRPKRTFNFTYFLHSLNLLKWYCFSFFLSRLSLASCTLLCKFPLVHTRRKKNDNRNLAWNEINLKIPLKICCSETRKKKIPWHLFYCRFLSFQQKCFNIVFACFPQKKAEH